MRAQSNIYHVPCFACSVCLTVLQTGDHFGVYENKLFCQSHYEQLQYGVNSPTTSTQSLTTSPLGLPHNATAHSVASQNNLNMSNVLSSSANLLCDDGFPDNGYPILGDFVHHDTSPEMQKGRRKKRQGENNSNNDQWAVGKSNCAGLTAERDLFYGVLPLLITVF